MEDEVRGHYHGAGHESEGGAPVQYGAVQGEESVWGGNGAGGGVAAREQELGWWDQGFDWAVVGGWQDWPWGGEELQAAGDGEGRAAGCARGGWESAGAGGG